LVEVEAYAIPVEVNNVGDARAVNVGEADAALIEEIRPIEPGCVVHRDLGAEVTIAEIRPVADLAVADPYQVGQSIAG
jgi:hypothetical protein